ncbi:uncharacterized protein A1O5_11092 [Cladophialophora psammophila CBS 110553]|uniref:Glutathione S-transferase n=1 Tax=Cladophialophora psammophila CBS 110553 TaxID=1182543 RepID=W9WML5_9EURO|nr:uncharacterized protein A1O5_11092 [Cladophialophora psammophila CBS 110553]EXJ65851.1 hypothetical protein A1O5_11092 [Cladophialophora psammophila CBS 110553]
MAPKLYCTKESGNCYKVRLLASFLDLQLDQVEVDFFNIQHRSPEFLAINPRGELPTLVDEGKVFNDSSVILVYLAGTNPDPSSKTVPSSYWSSDVVEQASIVDWLAFTASWIQFGLSKARAIVSFNWPADASEETLTEAKNRGMKSLEILEKRLEKEQWLALARPTVADVSVFVYVALAHMGDISLDPYPAVKAWIERIQGLPRFIPLDGLDKAMHQR